MGVLRRGRVLQVQRPGLYHLKSRRKRVCGELGWVEGWRQHSEKMVRRQEGCASWDNEADGGGKMGRADSGRQWVGRDDQRLRDIIQVVGTAGLANPRQDLIHLISSWGETTG